MRGASGWDGDRYEIFNSTGGQGIVWMTVWDSPLEASEFFDLLNQAVEKRYHIKPSGQAGATTRTYAAAGRTVEVSTDEVSGRPVVMYVDVPVGANTHVLDVKQIKLIEKK